MSGAIPPPLAASPLLERGGFDVFQGVLDASMLRAQRAEAQARRRSAEESSVEADDGEEIRGGSPARRFLSAAGGPAQDAFYQSSWTLAFLAELAGIPVAPTGERGTYTYYARPGDFLALHRDVLACDLAVISCLTDSVAGAGGSLRLYPGQLTEPLSAIRKDPERGAFQLRLLPGQTLVILGGLVPHAVLPVTPGQQRIVSVLCYQALVG